MHLSLLFLVLWLGTMVVAGMAHRNFQKARGNGASGGMAGAPLWLGKCCSISAGLFGLAVVGFLLSLFIETDAEREWSRREMELLFERVNAEERRREAASDEAAPDEIRGPVRADQDREARDE